MEFSLSKSIDLIFSEFSVPPDKTGRRKSKHHQWLTVDTGHVALQQHLYTLIAFMKASANWNAFHRMIERAFPKFGEIIPLPFEEK